MKKRLYFETLTAILILFYCGTVWSVPKGKADYFLVNYIRVDNSGKAFVKFEEELIQLNDEGLPTCQNGYKKSLAFDTNSAGGKSILALLLSAKAMGKPVYAVGTGTCNVYPNVIEDWNHGHYL